MVFNFNLVSKTKWQVFCCIHINWCNSSCNSSLWLPQARTDSILTSINRNCRISLWSSKIIIWRALNRSWASWRRIQGTKRSMPRVRNRYLSSSMMCCSRFRTYSSSNRIQQAMCNSLLPNLVQFCKGSATWWESSELWILRMREGYSIRDQGRWRSKVKGMIWANSTCRCIEAPVVKRASPGFAWAWSRSWMITTRDKHTPWLHQLQISETLLFSKSWLSPRSCWSCGCSKTTMLRNWLWQSWNHTWKIWKAITSWE